MSWAWWGEEKDGFKSRVENEQAWRVSLDAIKAGNFNLDLKNPHHPDTGPGDGDHLLPEYEKLLAQIAETRGQLKAPISNHFWAEQASEDSLSSAPAGSLLATRWSIEKSPE